MGSSKKGTALSMGKKNTGMFVKIAIFALAVFAGIYIVHLQLKSNALRTERDIKKAEVTAFQDQKDELEEKLKAPVDEKYIIDIAKDKLNLRLPEEIMFYNDLYN